MMRSTLCAAGIMLVACITVEGQSRGPVLTVSSATGRSTFRIGERIALVLSFSAEEEKQYQVNTATYDRSGRMNYESFDVSPRSGWADPLARYYSTGTFMGGGLTGSALLSSQPTTMPLDLNEWVRFDRTGDYTVTVSSRRVSKSSRPFGADPVAVKAAPLRIHVVAATAEWQKTRLKEIQAVLASVPAGGGMQPEPRKNAIADLRYLATDAALPLLAAEVRDDHLETQWQAACGLMGVPDSMRDRALRVSLAKIEDPGFPASGTLLTVVSTLEANGDGPPEETMRERGRYNLEVWRSTLTALPRKEGAAKAATAQMLSTYQSPDLSEGDKARVATLLADSFLDLSEERQAMALQWGGDRLTNARMLPTLKKLATLPLKDPGSAAMTDYHRRAVKSAALMRWYQLEPDEARNEILNEIGSATPSLTAESLSFLPEITLPQFEGVWAQAYVESGNDVLAGLLARFGTGSAASQIAAKLKEIGKGSHCEMQTAALAFLVKFDADAARVLLSDVCRDVSLQNVSRFGYGSPLEELALRRIGEPNDRVTSDALIYLMDYGTKAAKVPLQERYSKWTHEVAGRADSPQSVEAAPSAADWDTLGVGEGLARALLANQGWLADENSIAEIVKGCVYEQVCQQVKYALSSSAGPPYAVSLFSNGASENYTVAGYSCKSLRLLEEKVSQFPKGTKFRLMESGLQAFDRPSLLEEAQLIFKRAGMLLELVP